MDVQEKLGGEPVRSAKGGGGGKGSLRDAGRCSKKAKVEEGRLRTFFVIKEGGGGGRK